MVRTGVSNLFRYARGISKRGMAVLLVFAFMLSICVVSGFNVKADAATSNGQIIYINTSTNSNWENTGSIRARFATSSGAVIGSAGSVQADTTYTNVFGLTAPGGAAAVEISKDATFSPDTVNVVADGYTRVFYRNINNWQAPYVYAWSSSSDNNGKWPGVAMTRLSGSTYYIDIPERFNNIIFSNNGSSQTSDLTINKSYSTSYAYYNGSMWADCGVKKLSFSDLQGGNAVEYYINSSGGFTKSKYLTVLGSEQSGNSNVTMKPVYVVKSSWNSLDKIYAKYDYSDGEPYRASVEFKKETVDGQTVFKGYIPQGAAVKFGPNADNDNGATSNTYYPSGDYSSGFDGNTATFEIDRNNNGQWRKFSESIKYKYDAVTGALNNVSNTPGIFSVDATYFDYLSDNERSTRQYLNNDWLGYNGGHGNATWFPFTDFNSYISNIAQRNSSWKYPLYFGNLFKEGNQYNYPDEVSGLTRYNDNSPYYAINNSNGLSNYNQSIMGLAYPTLDADGDIQAADGLKMPYFDRSSLPGSDYAKVFKSYFPFRSDTDASTGVTTYRFDSTNATDNVFFTWNGENPTAVNYGAGTTYGVHDALSVFSDNNANGYGIFPFNNASSTNKGNRAGNDNLDFGFGIRLDIDFRVPENGTVDGTPDGTPVTFEYSGDDDLWVYISEDSTGANGQLVLDLGGDHKQASGSINFKDMTATADDVYYDYSSNSSNIPDVPDNEIWIKTDSSYDDFCLHVWQDTSVGTLNDGAYFIKPYSTSGGFYKFRNSQFGNNTAVDFEKYMNTSGHLAYISDLSSLYGKAWNGDGSSYTGGSSSAINGSVTKTFNNGVKLDPAKTYHMVVFYMERGLSESNFSVGFTMTPALNDLKVNKTLDTSSVNSSIAEDLIKNEQFGYSVQNSAESNLASKIYSIDGGNGQTLGSNNSFNLKHSQTADFNNQFKTGSQMTIDESMVNKALSYDTSWQLINNDTGQSVSNSNGSATNSSFKLINPVDEDEYASLQLNYVNKVQTAPLKISKNVVDEDGSTPYDTDQSFNFKIEVDLDGNGNVYDYKAYSLEYTLNGESYRTGRDGSFSLKNGESITLTGLPKGASYKITEDSLIGYKPYKVNGSDFNGTFTGVVGTDSSVAFTNIVNPTNTSITVNKTLDNKDYTGDLFDFTLTGLGAMQTNYPDPDNAGETLSTNSASNITATAQSNNGEVTFSNLHLVSSGYYRFKIAESLDTKYADQSTDFSMDDSTLLVEIYLDNNGEISSDNTKYFKVPDSALENVTTDADYAQFFNSTQYSVNANGATFDNTTHKGSATVHKQDQAGGNVPNTKFALFKIDSSLVNKLSDDQVKAMIDGSKGENSGRIITAITGQNGDAKFSDLVIFEDGQGQWTSTGNTMTWSVNSNYTNGTVAPQNYVLIEYEPANGYNPTSLRQYFTLPREGVYDINLENVTDGMIITPNAGNFGDFNNTVLIGLGVVMTGALCAGAYVLYTRKRKRTAHYRK